MLEKYALEDSWQEHLAGEFELDYMQKLDDFLSAETAAAKIIYPPEPEIFEAFTQPRLDRVKVVILGQDPYHGDGQAHGLSFSVHRGVAIPPSLKNIFKEISNEMALPVPEHGDLTHWANQGVLMLNAVLTVERAQAGSHRNRGWETFTDKVIEVVNEQCEGVVFLLWGSYAQKKGRYIDEARHLVLTAAHPSPLSAYRGFFGCGHFAATNAYLVKQGKNAIDWIMPKYRD